MNPPNCTIPRKEWASNSGGFGWFCTVSPLQVFTGIIFGGHGGEESINAILNAMIGCGDVGDGEWFRNFKRGTTTGSSN